MAQIIYGLISLNGDGSNSMNWFKNEKLVDYLLENEHYEFGGNEGSCETYTFPDELDLEQCGFRFAEQYYEKKMIE
jgi:hypothetical protein